jgi:nicotinamide mononucleotide adenylyltransferase
MSRIPAVTIHGRFQPVLHTNHWDYVELGFDTADHVTILITNPFNDEAFESTAVWRNDPSSNPFTFDERKYMFEKFFEAKGISKDKYDIVPFNITDPASFKKLDKDVPNLVSVYSDWSTRKVALFEDNGLKVIANKQERPRMASGTNLREVIREWTGSLDDLSKELITSGLLTEAAPALIEVLKERTQK